MADVMLQNDFEAWKDEIDSYMLDEQDQIPEATHNAIFDVVATSDAQILEKTFSGPGIMQPVGEIGDAIADNYIDGYRTSYTPLNYRSSYSYSVNLRLTDQLGQIEKTARNRAWIPTYTREVTAWGVLRNGFDSTVTYGDGKSVISVSHPLRDGSGTQANTFEDGVQLPLTYDNYVNLETQLYNVVSNSGNLMSVGEATNNKLLVVTPENREMAFQIAEAEYKPDTAENNVNYIMKGTRCDVLVTKYLNWDTAYRVAGETTVSRTSSSNYWDSMWFIVDKSMVKDYFKLYHIEGYPKFDEEIAKSNEVLHSYIYDYFTVGMTAHYPIVGSKGDNSILTT